MRIVLYVVWAWLVFLAFALTGAWDQSCLDTSAGCGWDRPTLRVASLFVAPALMLVGVIAGEVLARRRVSRD